MTAAFRHHDLRLLNPSYDSPLIDVLQELEHLRKLDVGGSTPPQIFYQLKSIFHMLESLGSARIEGNHTTLADYVDSTLDTTATRTDQMNEIGNIEHAMDFVDETIKQGSDLSHFFIRELHSLTVSGLQREGDKTPGAYRSQGVQIRGASHLPPEATLVPDYMQELIGFVNHPDPSKYDLMKVALAHHRFGWVHPFTNGNGRVVRLLTYAMLLKYGFNVGAVGRVLNPTAVFCNDRERYYQMLALADQGDEQSLEAWCEYVLGGILTELNKLERLTDFDYLRKSILSPALSKAREREHITVEEHHILKLAMDAEGGVVKSKDLEPALKGLTANQRTYRIKQLVQDRLIAPIHEGARQYTLCFRNNSLLRGVIGALVDEGFVPSTLRGET
ncbi:Fic family protein [Pseudoxanthomonas sp. UTMC 1351]|uniref:Fic family protein n=1 Tax=Pseudoxanthomonas sp. UTMC 1351 TaxID=2695853 RepID=UPI0034CF335A